MTNDYEHRLDELVGPDAAAVVAGLGLPTDVPIETLVQEHSWLGPLLDAGRDLPLQPVPRSLGVRLRALIHTHEPPSEADSYAAAPAQIAELQSDSRRRRELVGVRGGNVDNWTMMFRSPLADVVVGVSSIAEQAVRVSGQVLVHDGDSRQFQAALTGESARGSIHLSDGGDAFGRFTFEQVPTESLQLVLSDGVTDIVAALDLGPDGAGPESA